MDKTTLEAVKKYVDEEVHAPLRETFLAKAPGDDRQEAAEALEHVEKIQRYLAAEIATAVSA